MADIRSSHWRGCGYGLMGDGEVAMLPSHRSLLKKRLHQQSWDNEGSYSPALCTDKVLTRVRSQKEKYVKGSASFLQSRQ